MTTFGTCYEFPIKSRYCQQPELPLRLKAGNRLLTDLYRVSLKKGTFVIFPLISVLEVGFYFFTCVSESEFRAHFI